ASRTMVLPGYFLKAPSSFHFAWEALASQYTLAPWLPPKTALKWSRRASHLGRSSSSFFTTLSEVFLQSFWIFVGTSPPKLPGFNLVFIVCFTVFTSTTGCWVGMTCGGGIPCGLPCCCCQRMNWPVTLSTSCVGEMDGVWGGSCVLPEVSEEIL